MAGAWSDGEVALLRTLAAEGYTDREVAERMPGRSQRSIRDARYRYDVEPGSAYRERRLDPSVPPKEFDVEELPDELPTADELLERRRKQYARKAKAKEARRLIKVAVNVNGPIGIAHLGDPHLDDDGTDIAAVERDVDIINRTEGLFAGNVGDYSNNWVGRIAHLHGQQTVSAAEAWVLVEWFINAVDWMYLIGGNHDAWSGAGDPLKWISRQQGSLLEMHGARMGLQFRNGREIRINARHNWPGHSQWNPAHGVAKAAQMGHSDHILTCGHTHVSGYQVVKQPADGLISHAIQVASYKIYDRYAEERALRDQAIFNAPVTVIDPRYGDDDRRCVTFLPDLESGADYLRWLRTSKAAA